MELPKEEKFSYLRANFELARRRLMHFCYLVNRSYEYARHLKYLAEILERVDRGEIKKLMIFFGPRHGKSELVSCNFPAWYLGRNPDKRIIHTSYSESLSNEWSRRTRDIIEDEIYNAIFGITTDKDIRAVDSWRLRGRRGGMISIGVGGSATGHGADLFIIDDPIKNAQEAESEVYRDRLYEWYKMVARTRLEPNASIVLMMARWHQKDLAGKILENEKDWTVINIPALARENDPLGRSPGDALWPERYSREALMQIKHDIGSKAWASLFDGNPMDPESAIIHRDWIRWYKALPIEYERFGGIDTATSQKTSADNTSLVDVCKDWEGYLYVDEVFLEKPSVYGFANHVNAQHAATPYQRIKMESNNAGEAMKQRIDEVGRDPKTGSNPPVSLEQTTTDKVVRASQFAHLIENGTLRFKLGNPRIAALVDHLVNFDGKGSDVDDDVDALGFAIKAAMGGAVFFTSTPDFDVFARRK
jgi:predicted phage terminase large subunit-like protein